MRIWSPNPRMCDPTIRSYREKTAEVEGRKFKKTTRKTGKTKGHIYRSKEPITGSEKNS